MLILHRVFQIACLVFLFLNNYYIRKKNDKVELELNYDVITFEFDRSNVDIRIPIAVIEIKCVRKSKQVSNTAQFLVNYLNHYDALFGIFFFFKHFKQGIKRGGNLPCVSTLLVKGFLLPEKVTHPGLSFKGLLNFDVACQIIQRYNKDFNIQNISDSFFFLRNFKKQIKNTGLRDFNHD